MSFKRNGNRANIILAREEHNAATRRAFASLMTGSGLGFEESTKTFERYVGALKAEDPVFPPQPIQPMPAVSHPESAVVVLGHRNDDEGLTFTLEAIASAARQTTTQPQVATQLASEWWPEKINEAVAKTHGKYFAILPYDDRLHTDFMWKTIAVAEHSGAHIVYTDRMAFGAGDPRVVRSERVIRKEMFEYGCPLPFTTLIRRSWWDEMGGMDGTLGLCNNDFYFRSVCAGAVIACSPFPLVEYREHAGKGSRSMDLPVHYAALDAKWHALGLV